VEALEYAYPLRVLRYEIRPGSGGKGVFNGGDGLIREIQVLSQAQVTLLSERRTTSPYGLDGGQPGKSGRNLVFRNKDEIILPGKGEIDLLPGDILSIHTPGGGGYSNPATKLVKGFEDPTND
jgi:N-methylhydantoinase B